MSESSKTHKSKAPKILNFGIYICSTSRYKLIEQGEKEVNDVGGDTATDLLKKAGQNVLFKKIIADDKAMISEAVEQALNMPDLDVAIFSGGTGITPTDITIETVTPFFEKTLPGFGEFFRALVLIGLVQPRFCLVLLLEWLKVRFCFVFLVPLMLYVLR